MESRTAFDAASSGQELLVLVPSCREDLQAVRRTLLALALQQVDVRRRIFLLIDDPAHDLDADAARALAALRRLPDEITTALDEPRRWCDETLAAIAASPEAELPAKVAALEHRLAAWLDALGGASASKDHEEVHFLRTVLSVPATQSRTQACQAERDPDRGYTPQAARSAVLHLRARFDAQAEAFERKSFANLPDAPNKAMNLNAALGLAGGHYRRGHGAQAKQLVACKAAEAEWSIPATEFVAVVDADTVVEPNYLATMLEVLRCPEHARTAVAQTPYSAFPDAPGMLERTAGATTDVQYFVHQGMSRLGAAYWVGANAVLRMAAVRQLTRTEGEHRVFFSDRTVIEDTETSLELRAAGWNVESVPQRLAFSATPRDFGALVVQRMRWSNGGVLMLGAFARAMRSNRAGLAERWLRLHYLVSLGPTNLAMLLLPFCLFGDGGAASGLPLLAAVYLGLYGQDLRDAGYNWRDLPRVYALNLLLIPVHLAGLVSSLQQAISGTKTSFARTPNGGAVAPGSLLLCEGALLAVWVLLACDLCAAGRIVHATLVGLHVGVLAYAIAAFIGPREWLRTVLDDLRSNLVEVDPSDARPLG